VRKAVAARYLPFAFRAPPGAQSQKSRVGIGTLYTARATAFRRGPSGCVYKAMIQVAGTAEELVNEHIDFRTGES
jgi:hypothetical protein